MECPGKGVDIVVQLEPLVVQLEPMNSVLQQRHTTVGCFPRFKS